MSIGASPPQQPPQLSPDGKWVWDGRQWQPVPVVIGDVAGVMPVRTAVAASPAVAVAIPYSPPVMQAHPIFVPPAAEEVAPLWEQPARSGVSLYLYVVAGAVVLVMLMIVLNSLNFIQLPGRAPERPRTAGLRSLRYRNFSFARSPRRPTTS